MRPMTARGGSAVGLRIDRVSRFMGGRAVLSDVSLEAAPGQFVAVVGKSGCGKTTLLRLVSGLQPPTAGAITLDDLPLAAGVGDVRMVFQEARLLPWKRVIDNVKLGRRREDRGGAGARDDRHCLDTLARVGLAHRGRDWPNALSGGEKQRVALARALVSRPKLLLLDEPLGALDALTRLEMQRLLESIWLDSGFTAMLVTHDVHEAVALADRVISLDQGRVALDVAVPLARPRVRSSAAFGRIADAVLAHLLERDLSAGGDTAPASLDLGRASPIAGPSGDVWLDPRQRGSLLGRGRSPTS
jgi:sulfonate transport system ATP-binding protein